MLTDLAKLYALFLAWGLVVAVAGAAAALLFDLFHNVRSEWQRRHDA